MDANLNRPDFEPLKAMIEIDPMGAIVLTVLGFVAATKPFIGQQPQGAFLRRTQGYPKGGIGRNYVVCSAPYEDQECQSRKFWAQTEPEAIRMANQILLAMRVDPGVSRQLLDLLGE